MLLFLVSWLSNLANITNTVDLTTGQIITEVFSGSTAMWPWWQIAIVTALIVGFGMRIVPRIIKRMG